MMKPSRKLEKAHTALALEHLSVGLQLDKANVRIAELSEKVAELEDIVQLDTKAIVEHFKKEHELTAKVASLREALNAIDVIACVDRSHPVISTLARNALERD